MINSIFKKEGKKREMSLNGSFQGEKLKISQGADDLTALIDIKLDVREKSPIWLILSEALKWFKYKGIGKATEWTDCQENSVAVPEIASRKPGAIIF